MTAVTLCTPCGLAIEWVNMPLHWMQGDQQHPWPCCSKRCRNTLCRPPASVCSGHYGQHQLPHTLHTSLTPAPRPHTRTHTRLNQNVSHKPSHPTAMYSCTARPQLTQSRTLCDSAVSTPSCRRHTAHPAGLLSYAHSRPRLDLLPHIAALQLGQQPSTVRGPTPAAGTDTLGDCRHRQPALPTNGWMRPETLPACLLPGCGCILVLRLAAATQPAPGTQQHDTAAHRRALLLLLLSR